MLIVKTYDEDINNFKLNSSAEFIGALTFYPLTKEQEAERNELIAANEYMPGSEFLNIHRYPTLHLISSIPNPVEGILTDLSA